MNKKEQILQLVAEYITEKHAAETWEPGKDWVQYSGPVFDDKEYVAAVETLLNEWLVLGTDAINFEHRFPPLLGKSHGVITNSGSSANLLMIAAMMAGKSWAKKYKVIVPVAGFPTTLNPILQLGLEPVFVDIELDTLNLNLDQVEKAAPTSHMLMFAHVLGNPPNMNRVMELVNKYHLTLLEDCCDALGSTYNEKPLGSFGRFASCSFYPAHHITIGEGGFVACNNKGDEKVVRSLREWGRGCFIKGTLINTNEKPKTIENIRLGDIVISHNGLQKKVTRLFQKYYEGGHYTFTARLRNKISSTDYHPHLIMDKRGSIEWKRANEIAIGDCFLEKIPQEDTKEKWFEWKYKTLYQTKTEKLIAEPDLMRLIGYWLAEGCANRGLKGKWKYRKGNVYYAYTISFHFNKNETDYINDVKSLMKKYFRVSGFPGHKTFKGNATSICFKSRKAYEFFIQHFGKLSYQKCLPETMVNWSNILTSQLINGFWRGDGSYCDTNKNFIIDSTSQILTEQLRRMLLKQKILCSSFPTEKEKRQNNQILNGKLINAKHTIYHLAMYGENATLFSTNICGIPFMSRSSKQVAFIREDIGFACYPIRKIENSRINEMVYNLEVEDDHSYHASGIATHNCYCVGKKANLLKNGTCGCRYNKWLPSLPEEIFDHKYVYDNIGYNLKPIELQCSMGLAQLDKLPHIIRRRKENYMRLWSIFLRYEEFFVLPRKTPNSSPAWFAFPLTIRDGVKFKRSDFCQYLEDNKIQTRNYFGGNLLLQPAYRHLDVEQNAHVKYPVATKVTTDTFFLGTSPVITFQQLAYVEEKVNTFMKSVAM
jgi:dTDP-4-amino-4,6-dideoxygalactose transaminase